LALGSSSAGTSWGSTACAALLNTTSAAPRQNPAAISVPMSAAPAAASTAISATMTPCTAWARHISVARSQRSTSAPDGSDSSSQGTKNAADTSAMSRGSLVTVTASSGSADTTAPSPTLLTVLAHHTRQ
jgi:hypothetical protein